MTDSAPAPPPELIQLVTMGDDVTSIRNLLLKGEAKVDDTDSSGMTALHHAAYKGNADLCKMLIDHVSIIGFVIQNIGS
ncbi:Ankyrin repeat and MYND domain-containing protein 2 [Portunus trituberculatus]|uniref:Ankyrin repeat and MYND domain-containing protein 2 n=1 Tax=Portunus trituberculatus TaxID=210409 RepID=A0A5B7K4E7_PORTR|nr:Ankyrin repeat and MYND domain-containing protein 2 [Portunus trituberculatus]